MGGWASLLAARAKPQVKALILINPAPDFTEKMVYASWDDARREMLDIQTADEFITTHSP